MIEEHAPAKVNLALHVTGQRADGYHLLDTLVTFTEAGDLLSFEASDRDQFTVTGRFGSSLPVDADAKAGNLVLRARDALRDWARQGHRQTDPVHIQLEKNLPIASGIGGGSADAAATLRGLGRLWNIVIPEDDLQAVALALGADVPMCLKSRPLVARGIGEDIALLPDFPKLHVLLVNPLVEVSTPVIFRSLTSKNNPPLDLPTAPGASREDWLSALVSARNDLQPPAEVVEGKIVAALGLIRATGPVFARMSGSGATCFGIYPDAGACQAARAALEAVQPEWYVQATQTL
ncbi:MAG: ispE [Rhizobium sp.]|nr:ispE [Rhizobium sp.]